eukprot:scaffold4793_cov175-Amphora_coffeaeformis.AAC.15
MNKRMSERAVCTTELNQNENILEDVVKRLDNGSFDGILLNPEFCQGLHVHHQIAIKVSTLPVLVVVTQFINISNRVHHAHFQILTYFTSHSDLHIDEYAVITVFFLQSNFTSECLLPVFIIAIVCKAAASGARGHACRKGQLDDGIPWILSITPQVVGRWHPDAKSVSLFFFLVIPHSNLVGEFPQARVFRHFQIRVHGIFNIRGFQYGEP